MTLLLCLREIFTILENQEMFWSLILEEIWKSLIWEDKAVQLERAVVLLEIS